MGSDPDHKSRVKASIERYYARESKKYEKPKRKNAKPEKGVQVACVAWMRAQGWNVSVFEARATYSPSAGVWKQQAMPAGVSDCMGNMKDGHGVAVEFKAPGRLGTFADVRNDRQREFLITKIESGVFACVVDSVERLQSTYKNWAFCWDHGHYENAKKYLLGMVPIRRR